MKLNHFVPINKNQKPKTESSPPPRMETLRLFCESDYEYSGKNQYFDGGDPDDNPLPAFIISKIRSNIRHGAQNTSQQWANALELVHKAYKVTANMGKEVSAKGKPSGFAAQVQRAGIAIDRPTPMQEQAWKQYEEMIQFAVQELAKTRGLKGDWRMSSSVFRESLKPLNTFELTFTNGPPAIAESESLEQLTDTILSNLNEEYDVIVTKDNQHVRLELWQDGVKMKQSITITPHKGEQA